MLRTGMLGLQDKQKPPRVWEEAFIYHPQVKNNNLPVIKSDYETPISLI
jgi:hypothetical protein